MTTLINDCLTTTNGLSLRRFKGFLDPEYDIVPLKVQLINPHTELEVLIRGTPAKVRQKRNCSSSR